MGRLAAFYRERKINLRLWIRAVRAPFFTASIVPVILGGAVAFSTKGTFEPIYFLLTLIGVVFLHAAGNLLNDYFDFKSGADVINTSPTPFSGGSRVLVDGTIAPAKILLLAVSFMAVGLSIGVLLASKLDWMILWFGIAGAVLGIMYSAPPVKLVYRGFGELIVALVFGPLILLGTYFVQTGTFSASALFASLPLAFLIAAVLLINEFPDYEFDKAAGKNQFVVISGRKNAVWVFGFFMIAAYASILTGIILGLIPTLTFLGILTAPQAKKAVELLTAH